jgi:hypothetical protein
MSNEFTLEESLKLKNGFNKREEILQLDLFINKFKESEQFNEDIFKEMFLNLIENRLNISSDK